MADLDEIALRAKKAASFDAIAQSYRDDRPGYPVKLFGKIGESVPIGPSTWVLEVGAGDGKASREILRRWHPRLTLVEPGARFCAQLKTLRSHGDEVEVVHSSFEEYSGGGRFDVVISATAFHWPDVAVKYRKAASLLGDDGRLVLFWNNYSRGDDPVFDRIQLVLERGLPQLWSGDVKARIRAKISSRVKEIEDSGFFDPISHTEILSERRYDADGYVRLLRTFSDFAVQPADALGPVLHQVAGLIRENGDEIRLPIITNLEIARRKDQA